MQCAYYTRARVFGRHNGVCSPRLTRPLARAPSSTKYAFYEKKKKLTFVIIIIIFFLFLRFTLQRVSSLYTRADDVGDRSIRRSRGNVLTGARTPERSFAKKKKNNNNNNNNNNGNNNKNKTIRIIVRIKIMYVAGERRTAIL